MVNTLCESDTESTTEGRGRTIDRVGVGQCEITRVACESQARTLGSMEPMPGGRAGAVVTLATIQLLRGGTSAVWSALTKEKFKPALTGCKSDLQEGSLEGLLRI